MIKCPDISKAPVPQEILDTHDLVFEDNFNGPSLDYSKWSTRAIWSPVNGNQTIINDEEQYYVDTKNNQVGLGYPDPFSFDGQNLGITAEYQPDIADSLLQGQQFTSGWISTHETHLIYPNSFTRVCAKMPCGTTGLWGAIWLLNRYYRGGNNASEDVTGPNGKYEPEIDWEFVEGVGGPFGGGPYDTSCAIPAYHYDGGYCKIDANGFGCNPANNYMDPAVSQQCDGTPLGTNFNPAAGFDPVCNMGDTCEDFHVYDIEWKNDRIVWWMDGVPVRSVCDVNIVSQVPMYLIINQAVGGNFPGPADPNDYPATMLINSVEIYQQ